MAEWNFNPLQAQDDALPDNDDGGMWAGLNGFANAGDFGVWSSDTWDEPSTDHNHNPDAAFTPHHRHVAAHYSRPSPLLSNNQSQTSPHATSFPDSRSVNPATVHRDTNHYHTPSQDLHSTRRQSNSAIPAQTFYPTDTLNPASLLHPDDEEQHQNRRPIPDSHSQVLQSDSEDADDMAPSNRRHSRNSNLVDLTQSPTMPTGSATQQSRTRKRSSASTGGHGGSANKRTKRTSSSAAKVEDEDLQDEAPSAEEELLKSQQQDALKMQEANKNEGALKVGQRTCIICLENYTNATISSCGESNV